MQRQQVVHLLSMIPSFQYNGILGCNLSQVSYVKAFYRSVFLFSRDKYASSRYCLVPLDPVTYRHTYFFYREIHNRCRDNELNDSFGTKQRRFFTKEIVHKKMQGNVNFHQNVDASAIINPLTAE